MKKIAVQVHISEQQLHMRGTTVTRGSETRYTKNSGTDTQKEVVH